jgi:hypothetical protein
LEDGRDSRTERNSVITETDDVTSGARDTEESGGTLFLKRSGDFLGNHLEFHLQIDEMFIQ